MSRVDELIKKLCPNGVPFVQIGSVVQVVSGLKSIKRSAYGAGTQYPIIDQGMQQIAGYTNDASLLVEPGEYIVFGDHTRVVKFADFQFAIGADGTKILIPLDSKFITPKYLFYALQNIDIPNRGYNRHWSLVRELELPVPPLEIQREIVKILDKFTQLEAELEAELEARRKQYAYYLEKLGEVLRTKFPTTSLGDVGDWAGGNTPSKGDPKYWENGEILWVSSKDMKSSHITATKFRVTERAISEGPARMIPKGAVLVVTRSSILERTLPVANLATEATINQDIKAIIPSGEFDHRYIYFAIKWSADEILRTIRKSGGSVTSLDTKKLKGFKIPAPPLEEQRRIVAILDKFDALVNGISTGLPAEIAARRKQYEYYRDKLLSFEPV